MERRFFVQVFLKNIKSFDENLSEYSVKIFKTFFSEQKKLNNKQTKNCATKKIWLKLSFYQIKLRRKSDKKLKIIQTKKNLKK